MIAFQNSNFVQRPPSDLTNDHYFTEARIPFTALEVSFKPVKTSKRFDLIVISFLDCYRNTVQKCSDPI